MKKKTTHKFQERVYSGMTYEQYFRDRCHEMVCLAEELERVLGRKKAVEAMGKARDRYVVEITKRKEDQSRVLKISKQVRKPRMPLHTSLTL